MSTRGATHVLEGHGRGRPHLRPGVPRTTSAQRSLPSAHICFGCVLLSGEESRQGIWRLPSWVRVPSRFTVVDRTSNKELINTAQGVLNPHTVGGRLFGNVVDPANLDTEVILGHDRSALVRELLPAHDWPRPLASD